MSLDVPSIEWSSTMAPPSPTLWGPFLCIYEGPCNFGASFGAPQIEQCICHPIGSCLVEDCGAVASQRLEEHLLQERGAIA